MRSLLSLLTVAGLFGLSALAPAQDKPAEKKAPVILKRLIVTVGSTVRLQMTTKRPIATAINENEEVIRVAPLEGDPTTILITGLRPGITRLTLTDVDGKKEVKQFGKPPAPPK